MNEKHTYTLTARHDNVVDNILAESARRATYNAGAYILTRDNSAMIEKHLRHAFDEFALHAAAYIKQQDYNPLEPNGGITVTLEVAQPLGNNALNLLEAALERVLANWALSAIYGERDADGSESLYHLSWRHARAQFMIILARECR